jgi:hypothetical protein
MAEPKGYDVNATRIFLYCFDKGPDKDDPSAPGKKRKDEGGQRVIQAEWRPDCKVYCPRCRRMLIFDGDRFYDNLTGKLHFSVTHDEDGKAVPHGHFFRADLKGVGYVSPRYVPPRPGETPSWDWDKELERMIKEESVLEMDKKNEDAVVA